jgi:hypothetical protein
MAISIPSPVSIGGVPHSISLADTLPDDQVGQIIFRQNAITLLADQSPAEMRDTLLHEVMHAVVRFVGLDLDENERVTAALTSTLLMVLRANPALVAYLTATDA